MDERQHRRRSAVGIFVAYLGTHALARGAEYLTVFRITGTATIMAHVFAMIPHVGTFRGIGFIGYNNVDGQYELAWMDTMSTAIVFETATYDPEKKILEFRGSHRDPLTGRVIQRQTEHPADTNPRGVFVGDR